MTSGLTIEKLGAALERVRENEGCAGVDGVTVDHFAKQADERMGELLEAVAGDDYRAYPLLMIEVEKKPGSGKVRRLLVPAVRDRVLQTAVARELSPSFEEEFLESSFAYRPGRSVDRAVARIIQLRDRGFIYVLDADITTYFDSVSHILLKELIAAQGLADPYPRMIGDWIGASYWDGREVKRLRPGIPQGSPISPLLANFFLADFDAELERSEFHLVRFADDFLVLCQTEDGARKAMEMVGEWLTKHELSLNLAKTQITGFHVGFTFLGVHFRGQDVFIPWKYARPVGRLLFKAGRMPERMLELYRTGRPRRKAMAEALRQAGVTVVVGGGADGVQKGGTAVAQLYVTEQGAIVRKSGDRFLVEKEDRIVLDVPYHKLEAVLLFGNVQITTQAMGEMLEKAVPVSLLTRTGRFLGSLTPPHGKDVLLRKAQYALEADEARSFEMSRLVLKAKLGNAASVLRVYGERARAVETVAGTCELLEKLRVRLDECTDLASALGIEGTAAREYFPAVMRFNRSDLVWKGRAKHPPPDPINALLSLVYTLLLHEMASLTEALGLDPYLGFLHEPDFGRPSLALDLLEPLRHPVADRFVLTEINRRVIAGEDFEATAQGGCVLKPASLKRLLLDWDGWMTARKGAFRSALREQVEGLVGALRHGREWKPFEWQDPTDAEEEKAD